MSISIPRIPASPTVTANCWVRARRGSWSSWSITVTDRNTTRYFMLTSEAVQLVMQSATLTRDEAIYLLDMGEPVKIVDLAQDMIRLSCLEPDIDIKIDYIGLRPGEKVHEELYSSGKGEPTTISKISLTTDPVPDPEHLWKKVDKLTRGCFAMSRGELLQALGELVPDYRCSEMVQKDQVNSDNTTTNFNPNGQKMSRRKSEDITVLAREK